MPHEVDAELFCLLSSTFPELALGLCCSGTFFYMILCLAESAACGSVICFSNRVSASEGDADGALPCDVGQEYELCDDAEYEKMEKFLQEKLAHPSGNRPTPQNMEPMTHRRIYPDVGAGRNAHSKPKRVEEL